MYKAITFLFVWDVSNIHICMNNNVKRNCNNCKPQHKGHNISIL